MQPKKRNHTNVISGGTIVDSKLVITTEPKKFLLDFPGDADSNSEHKIYAIRLD